MDFIKKNLAFCIFIFICLLACAAGLFFAFSESGKVSSAQKKINSAEAQLNSLLVADPAPSQENVEASQQNVVELEAQLKSIREDLHRGSRLTTSSDGVGVMASVQQYITEYQRRAESRTDAEGNPDPIVTPNDFGFGFEAYIKQAQPPTEEKKITTLDKQRQILTYIVNQLIEANPAGITAVQREILEAKAGAAGNTSQGPKSFKVDEAISAYVPGAIDTMGFSVTFTGYTDSLRVFLNNLAKFELPIVVRSIEVGRPQGATTTIAPAQNRNALDDIFAGFGGGSSTPAEEPKEAQKPIISENVSTFTVVLEFIEIVIPSDSEENPS